MLIINAAHSEDASVGHVGLSKQSKDYPGHMYERAQGKRKIRRKTLVDC